MFKFYFKAKNNNIDISFKDAILMSIRKTNKVELIDNYIVWKNYKKELKFKEIEAYYLCDVNIELISKTMQICEERNIITSLETLIALELSGNNLLKTICNSYKEEYQNIDINEIIKLNN